MTKPHEQTTETAESAPDPRLVHGIVAALQGRLADYQSACVASIDKLVGTLRRTVKEPSSGPRDDIIAELEAARRALGALDAGHPAHADELGTIARRLNTLAQTTTAMLASNVGLRSRAGA